MLVKSLLENKAAELFTVTAQTSIEAAMDLLISRKISCLPVLDEAGELCGIVSDKDIFKLIHQTHGKYHDLTVADIMSSNLIVGVPEDELDYIAGVMDKNWIRHVPIVDDGKLVGMISSRDIIKHDARRTEIENRYLNLYMESLGSRDRSADN